MFPFNLPILLRGLDISFARAVTILVGENGSGKSTVIEAIAAAIGFNVHGGNRNHLYAGPDEIPLLASKLKMTWNRKTGAGFFFRAESFMNFATYLDGLAAEYPGDHVLEPYGGRSLHQQSHGESFLALITHRLRKGIFLLDEPESALSPMRQLSLLYLIQKLAHSGQAQFIIATHSPLLLSCPGAEVLKLTSDGIQRTRYQDTEHFVLMKRFLDDPERYFHHLFNEHPR